MLVWLEKNMFMVVKNDGFRSFNRKYLRLGTVGEFCLFFYVRKNMKLDIISTTKAVVVKRAM